MAVVLKFFFKAYCGFLDGSLRYKLQKSCPWYNEGGDWHNWVYIKLWLLLNSGSFICWSDLNLYSMMLILRCSSLDNLCRSILYFSKKGTFGRHFVIFGIFLIFFLFAHGGRSFLFCIDLCWWRCSAPQQSMSVSLKKKGGKRRGGARFDLFSYSFFSLKKV